MDKATTMIIYSYEHKPFALANKEIQYATPTCKRSKYTLACNFLFFLIFFLFCTFVRIFVFLPNFINYLFYYFNSRLFTYFDLSSYQHPSICSLNSSVILQYNYLPSSMCIFQRVHSQEYPCLSSNLFGYLFFFFIRYSVFLALHFPEYLQPH